MREEVRKVLFVGTEDEKSSFFKMAQQLGIIHFIDPQARPRQEWPEDVQRIARAIKILRGLPPQEQEENFSHLKVEELTQSIIKLAEQSESLQEELRVLSLEISRIAMFGDFSFQDLAYIQKESGAIVQFFVGSPSVFHDKEQPEELVYVASENNLDYYIAINEKQTSYDKLIEMKIDRSLSELKNRSAKAQEELRMVDQKLKNFVKYNEFLHKALFDYLNKFHLYNTQTYVQEAMEGILFAVEGWVPHNQLTQVNALVEKLNVHAEEVAIEATDIIPTFLDNKGTSRLGEDLVDIYDTPSATDSDPSNWVLWSFVVFFAFIIGDAGYGLLFLLAALFFRYKYPEMKGAKKRFLNLFTILSIGCIVWGTLMSSFFSIPIDPNSPIRKVSLISWLAEKKAAYIMENKTSEYESFIQKYPELGDAKTPREFVNYDVPGKGAVVYARLSDNVMFELALCIGVIHLVLSLLRYSQRNIPNFGWAVFLIGTYIYLGYYLNTPTFINFVLGMDMQQGGVIGMQLLIAGIAFAWLSAIFINGWKGVFEIMNLIQVFADTLSYLRLYALALAGAIVGGTINEIAGGLPLIFAALLVFISHIINIALGAMGGVIHGLRLNFIEYYHYSFEGGGKPFKPLKLIKRE
jgi:V/A-type H+-transporting ATPase subunit I